MSKYESLTTALSRQNTRQWRVSFEDIETIIGTKLPNSAYRHRAWWSNNPTNSVMTKAWLKAGWISSDVDMAAQKVTFRKSETPRTPQGTGEPPTPAFKTDLAIELESAPRQSLAMIAAASGETMEETATRLLTQAIEIAAPPIRADSARKAILARTNLKEIDLDQIVNDARDMH